MSYFQALTASYPGLQIVPVTVDASVSPAVGTFNPPGTKSEWVPVGVFLSDANATPQAYPGSLTFVKDTGASYGPSEAASPAPANDWGPVHTVEPFNQNTNVELRLDSLAAAASYGAFLALAPADAAR